MKINEDEGMHADKTVEKKKEHFAISIIYQPTFTYERIALPATYLRNSAPNDLN